MTYYKYEPALTVAHACRIEFRSTRFFHFSNRVRFIFFEVYHDAKTIFYIPSDEKMHCIAFSFWLRFGPRANFNIYEKYVRRGLRHI